ncbi:MAG: VOC family protein [Planctomycetes bacterium]|nr:VOC family protein [Planctomycetota bacterium]
MDRPARHEHEDAPAADRAGAAGPLAGARLSYLFLTVRDLGAMLAFYRDALGLEVEFQDEGRCAFLRLGGARVALYAGGADGPAAAPHWFVSLDVEGIEEVAAALRARGVALGPVETVPYGRAAPFRDPEGNAFQLHEPDR